MRAFGLARGTFLPSWKALLTYGPILKDFGFNESSHRLHVPGGEVVLSAVEWGKRSSEKSSVRVPALSREPSLAFCFVEVCAETGSAKAASLIWPSFDQMVEPPGPAGPRTYWGSQSLPHCGCTKFSLAESQGDLCFEISDDILLPCLP